MDPPVRDDGAVRNGGVVERSASHVLTRDDDRWALWSVDQDSDEPLLTFAADPAGEERARTAFTIRSREARRVRALGIVAIVVGAVWLTNDLLTFLIRQLVLANENEGVVFRDVDRSFWEDAVAWLQTSELVARSAFEVAVGLFVVMWLQRRWRREG